jgi:hypothetical protein
MQRHDPEVEQLLVAAGWYPGRQVTDLVARWRGALESDGGFQLHPAAESVLLEYGGLVIDSHGPGRDLARAPLHLDPTLALGEEDRLHEYFPELAGRDFFPLGETDNGHVFLAIDRGGAVVQVMDEVYGRWSSFERALESLLLGRRGSSYGEAAS